MTNEHSDSRQRNPRWREALYDFLAFSASMVAISALEELHKVGKPITEIIGSGMFAGLIFALFQFYRSD